MSFRKTAPSRRDSHHDAALHDAAEEPPLHRDYQGQEGSGPGRREEGHWYGCKGQGRGSKVVEAGRVAAIPSYLICQDGFYGSAEMIRVKGPRRKGMMPSVCGDYRLYSPHLMRRLLLPLRELRIIISAE